MEYSNPELSEHINVSKQHPLKDLFVLGLGVIVCIIFAVTGLSLIAERLAVHIPFSLEQELTSKFIEPTVSNIEVESYLQALADELITHMDIPDSMSITVHYVDDDMANAFATLGGHIFIYRGLLALLPHENSLAMVISHEIAHIQHRHPIMAMGRAVIIGLLFASLSGLSANLIIDDVINSTGMITMLSFNRGQERQSDKTALHAIAAYYGHVSGAADLFHVLLNIKNRHTVSTPQFLSTHPLSKERIDKLTQYTADNGWQADQAVQQLPDFIGKL